MSGGLLWPILMMASIAASVIATTWIRARHGYPLENDDGTTSPKLADANSQLEAENQELKQQMSKLLERVAVLERIVTDPAERTAREIESLRAAPTALEREREVE